MIRTIVVDDDFRVAGIHVAYVQRVPGFEVVGVAHAAADAAALIDAERPDLMLLDLYLPDEHGLELLRRLRRDGHPAVDAIVVTAAKDADSVRSAMQLGGLHYLLKPFTFEVFQEKLLSYAAMRAQLSAQPEPDQDQVDRIFGALRSGSEHPGKRRNAPSLQTVERIVSNAAAGVTALQVAEASGMSRATAQRYLSHLETLGRLRVQLRYGGTGRPEHIYHWVSRT